jgi:hypothetical protein
VPKEPEKDTQLQYALKVLRGEIAVEATKKAEVPATTTPTEPKAVTKQK